MNCHNVRELLPSLIYGDLPDRESAAVRHHLDECPSCAEEHHALLQVRRSLDLVGAEECRVDLPRLYQQAFAADRRRARRWRAAALAMLAAAACLLVLVFARLEVRVEEHQLTVRWGEHYQRHEADTSPAPVAPPGSPAPGVHPEDFQALRQLVHAAIDDARYRDGDRQTEILELAARLEWLEAAYRNARQDIHTLYTVHSGTLGKGDQR